MIPSTLSDVKTRDKDGNGGGGGGGGGGSSHDAGCPL